MSNMWKMLQKPVVIQQTYSSRMWETKDSCLPSMPKKIQKERLYENTSERNTLRQFFWKYKFLHTFIIKSLGSLFDPIGSSCNFWSLMLLWILIMHLRFVVIRKVKTFSTVKRQSEQKLTSYLRLFLSLLSVCTCQLSNRYPTSNLTTFHVYAGKCFTLTKHEKSSLDFSNLL